MILLATLNQPIIYLLLGTCLGGLIGFLVSRLMLTSSFLPKREVKAQFVDRSLYQALEEKHDVLYADLQEKTQEIKGLSIDIATISQKNQYLLDQLKNQEWEFHEWQERSKAEFKVLANQLLEEKSQKFTQQNWEKLTELLMPLKEKIVSFENQIEKKFLAETKDRISLKKEMEQLKSLNLQLSQDANNLASALKNNSKVQGDWGEIQLQLLLEKAGLSPNIHFQIQSSFRDLEGKQKRPDFIIHLPNQRHLVIDSKVSLRDYERYYHSATQLDRAQYLKNHIQALKKHIKDLSSKKYQSLYQINSPDYVIMYIPIEPALLIAQQEEKNLFLEALHHNIILVSNSTLLSTMRTIAHIWKQEKQKQNVLEIARQSGLLYDKFCNFINDLKDVGHKLNQAQTSYHKAINKLSEGKRSGDTLIGKAEKIKQLGAKTTKSLPDDLLDA